MVHRTGQMRHAGLPASDGYDADHPMTQRTSSATPMRTMLKLAALSSTATARPRGGGRPERLVARGTGVHVSRLRSEAGAAATLSTIRSPLVDESMNTSSPWNRSSTVLPSVLVLVL